MYPSMDTLERKPYEATLGILVLCGFTRVNWIVQPAVSKYFPIPRGSGSCCCLINTNFVFAS